MTVVNKIRVRGILQSCIHSWNTQPMCRGSHTVTPEPGHVQADGEIDRVAVLHPPDQFSLFFLISASLTMSPNPGIVGMVR